MKKIKVKFYDGRIEYMNFYGNPKIGDVVIYRGQEYVISRRWWIFNSEEAFCELLLECN